MDSLHRRFSQNGDHLKWRAPPNPCGPSSPQSPPPLVVRGKSLSLNKVRVLGTNGGREKTIKELSRTGRRQRLLLSQAGSLSLKRRETSPDFHQAEAKPRPKRGKVHLYTWFSSADRASHFPVYAESGVQFGNLSWWRFSWASDLVMTDCGSFRTCKLAVSFDHVVKSPVDLIAANA